MPNGKVGGVADVVRDLPVALAARGWEPVVLTPAYGILHRLPGAQQQAQVSVEFADATQTVALHTVPGPDPQVSHYVLDHRFFSPRGRGLIYCDDDGGAPFATDAAKFAFFCAAAASALAQQVLPPTGLVHLHDWPSALFPVLRAFHPAHAPLKEVPAVFTIHNLAIQGVRPLEGDASSLQAWFPGLDYEKKAVTDPRWTDCINPMAAAIRLADRVSTVSPSYAREILQPNAPQRGFAGGEGLEADLAAAHADGRLIGILNGCSYPKKRPPEAGWGSLRRAMLAETLRWIGRESEVSSAHFLADKRLAALPARRPGVLLTSVGRIGPQKIQLFREEAADGGTSALAAILSRLGRSGLLVMLGSGDPEYEQFLTESAAAHDNFLFLRGFSEPLASLLYTLGDLFLMPSSFEPCGISQMLAMRAGQLCVVHGVGGLKDTVIDGETGFVFDGGSSPDQARHFVDKVAWALELRSSRRGVWQRMRRAAAAARFTWEASAATYEKELYGRRHP